MTQEFLVGSRLVGLESPADSDRLVVVENADESHYKALGCLEGVDTFERSTANIKAALDYRLDREKWHRAMIYNYQLDRALIGPDFPFEFHLLDHRHEALDLVGFVLANGLMNFNKILAPVAKSVYHLAYTLFILKNGSPVLTAADRAVVNGIHDRKTDPTFLDDLKALYLELREAER